MSTIIVPPIFTLFPNVRAGMTTRGRGDNPLRDNLSMAVGDEPALVAKRRARFAERLGFVADRLALQRQVHGETIVEVGAGYEPGDSDGMIADTPGILLAVSIADCGPVLLYDPEAQAVAAIHSGWRGTAQGIAAKAVDALQTRYNTAPATIHAWIGPAAGACCYEVGPDVADRFDPIYSRSIDGDRSLFDNRRVILDQLRAAGIPSAQIAIDIRCTICSDRFHSYRRDGARSGRMLAGIGIIEPS